VSAAYLLKAASLGHVFEQSKEQPADGCQSTETASSEAKEIGHTLAA
jgi:hypothetical protein